MAPLGRTQQKESRPKWLLFNKPAVINLVGWMVWSQIPHSEATGSQVNASLGA